MPFPNERAISQHDLISAAEYSVFTDFDDVLVQSGYSETRLDFDFTQIPLPNLHGHAHIIARPKPGVQQKVWVNSDVDNAWYEDAHVDAAGAVTSSAIMAGPGPAPPTGSCVSCGASTALPLGSTARFCPNCGAQQSAVSIPLIPGHGLIPGLPQPHPGQQAQPGFDPNRMTGNQKPPVVIPEGLGKTSGEEDFFAFIDKAVKAGEEE